MAENNQRKMIRQAMQIAAVPLFMGLTIVGCWFLGVYLDRRWEMSTPVATIGLVILGVVGSGYQAYRMIMKALKD